MSQQETIVLATDLSDNARSAAKWADNYARAGHARVVVLHVVELNAAHWLEGAFDYLEDPERKQQVDDAVRKWYHDATGAAADGVEVRAGTAVVQISDAVKELGANIAVVARTGRRAVRRFLLGSSAKTLALNPPCDVVIVHPDHDRATVRDIVVGTDFSINADHAISTAAALARRHGAKLHIVHGEEFPRVSAVESPYGWEFPDSYRRKDSLADSAARMNKVEAAHAGEFEGIEYATLVEHAPADEALLACCEENGADLLVIGRAGHSPLVASMLGTVVNQLVHAAPTTLLISPAG